MRAEENGYDYSPGRKVDLPTDYDSCDWRFNGRGPYSRQPKFWDYAKHSACHWVADLALYVAMKSSPDTPWRILTSSKHTTVWNGCILDPILFDINFQALGITAEECIKLASSGKELRPGVYLKAYLHTGGIL